jgi:hypothetical protein
LFKIWLINALIALFGPLAYKRGGSEANC